MKSEINFVFIISVETKVNCQTTSKFGFSGDRTRS